MEIFKEGDRAKEEEHMEPRGEDGAKRSHQRSKRRKAQNKSSKNLYACR